MNKAMKKECDFLTKVVFCVLVYLVLFSVAMTIVFVTVGSEPSTLIQWTFTVFGIELVATMTKTILDKKFKSKEDDKNDEDRLG